MRDVETLDDLRAGLSLYTVGHSNHAASDFINLLTMHAIEVLVDVRSQPYSRYAAHFDKPGLSALVTAVDIKYLFLGKELGGRPDDMEFYDPADGRVLYDRVAASPLFLSGLARLETGLQKYRVAMMCGEENPEGCHRRLLVGRVLAGKGIAVLHIRGDGRVEPEQEFGVGEDAQARSGQLSLFPQDEVRAWKSILSVLPKDRRPASSEP